MVSETPGTEAGPVWWWLSFADQNLPKGSQFLGVAIVDGYELADAVTRSHLLGINPDHARADTPSREGGG